VWENEKRRKEKQMPSERMERNRERDSRPEARESRPSSSSSFDVLRDRRRERIERREDLRHLSAEDANAFLNSPGGRRMTEMRERRERRGRIERREMREMEEAMEKGEEQKTQSDIEKQLSDFATAVLMEDPSKEYPGKGPKNAHENEIVWAVVGELTGRPFPRNAYLRDDPRYPELQEWTLNEFQEWQAKNIQEKTEQ
jgi:hypothetical protein